MSTPEMSKQAVPSTALFRTEVFEARKSQWLGPVLVLPKLSHRLMAGVSTALAVAVLSLVVFGTYPRKVRVSGWVVPESGMMQVYARQPGVITDVTVEEGAVVTKGQRLATLSGDLESASLGKTGEEIARQLAARKASLLEDRRNAERLAEQQKRAFEEKLSALKASENRMGSALAVQGMRVRSADVTVGRQKAMMKAQIASGEHVQIAEEAKLEQVAKLHELDHAKLLAERDRLTLQADLDELPLKLQRDLAAVDRNIALVDEQIAEAAAKRELAITAPEDGVVTTRQAKRGEQPDVRTPLFAIAPKGSPLEAQIFCSSRAVGFLKPGQRVLLRYEAFPYQKFGHYEGTVTRISRSAVSPSEMAPQLAALAKLSATGEAVYRVDVALASQAVRAYGESVALQPGMQLEADIVLESRRVVEWMLEPLFTVSGTWKR